MESTTLKIPISSRINPGLKEELEAEAFDLNLTTSLYLEQILLKRNAQTIQDEVLKAEIEELQTTTGALQKKAEFQREQIQDLKKDRSELERQLQQVRAENTKLKASAEKLETELQPLQRLGISGLSQAHEDELNRYFNSLQTKYPDLPRIYLLLASLNRTVTNEKSMWFIHTIDKYFD